MVPWICVFENTRTNEVEERALNSIARVEGLKN
jgi:hypothetical protein